jgi:glutamyl-tRNA synthetase
LFLAEPALDLDAWAKATSTPESVAVLRDTLAAFDALELWSADSLKAAFEAVAERHGVKAGKAQAPVRVAVTGRTVGPPLFESLEHLGRTETLRRLGAGVARLG